VQAMKGMFAIFAVLISVQVIACDKPVHATYGPFFSVSFYQEFLSDFHSNIEELTGCKVVMKIEPTHKKFILALVQGDVHMSFVPEFYYAALRPYGLWAVIESKTEFRNILIVNRGERDNFDVNQLSGKTILVSGTYSRGYIMLNEWLKDTGLAQKVLIDAGHRHDVIAMMLAKKKGSVGVISTAIFDRLPDNLKDNYTVLKKSQPLKSLLLVSEQAPSGVRAAVEGSLQHMNFGKWGAVTNDRQYPHRSEHFKRQLKSLMEPR